MNLTSKLIISLQDMVSGPAGGVTSALQKVQAAADKIAGISSKANLGSKALLNPLKNVGTENLDETYAAWDKLSLEIAAITETGVDGMDRLHESIRKISKETKQPAQDLLEAALAWVQLGGKLDALPGALDIAGKTSLMTHSKPAEQMTAVNAMIKAFGQNPNDASVVKKFDEVLLVASKGMYGGLHAFEESMKSFAPVAKSMGITLEQAAALVQTLGGQFQAEEIGNALKTSFVRLMSPRSGALPQLRAAGIDYTKWFNFDIDKMQSQGGLDFAERLRGMGREVAPELEENLNQAFEEADLSKGAGPLQDKLTALLTDAYGHATKKGKSVLDGQTAKDMAAAVAQAVQAYRQAFEGFNLEEFFKDLGPQSGNVPLMDKLFGVNRIPQMMDLLRQSKDFAERLKHINEQAPGAIDRKWEEFFNKADSYSRSIDRLTTAWDNLWKAMADNGVGQDIAKIANGLASLVESAAKLDPVWSRLFFWVTTIGSAVGTLVAGLIALRTSLKIIAAIGGSGAATTAASGGGLLPGAAIAVPGFAAAAQGDDYFRRNGFDGMSGWMLNMLGRAFGHPELGMKKADAGTDRFGFAGAGFGDAKIPSAAETIHAAGPAVANGTAGSPSAAAPDPHAVTNAAQDAVGQANSIFAGAAASFESAGRNAAQAFANGIRAGIGAITAAAHDAAAAATMNAARGAFGDVAR